jgi:hypothetical protein
MLQQHGLMQATSSATGVPADKMGRALTGLELLEVVQRWHCCDDSIVQARLSI